MKVYCEFSLESPQFECLHTTYHFNNKKKITPDYSESAATGFLPRDSRMSSWLKTARVNKPSVFEPLKFYCINLREFLLLSLEEVPL